MVKAAVLGLMVLGATPSFANEMETMICRNGIVSKGDLEMEVVAKCGEPTQRSQREEKRFNRVKGVNGREQSTASLVTVSDWTFNFGPNEFMQRLLFENGRLVSVQSLGYGFTPPQ